MRRCPRFAPRLLPLALAAPLLAVPAGLGMGIAPALAAPADDIRLSEIESSGEGADWVELVNTGAEPVDLSGWFLRDDKDERDWAVPAGTTIAPGEHLVLEGEETDGDGGFDFGLGKADQARLYLPDGATEVDAVSWDGHAATTYIVVDGELVTAAETTKGAENSAPLPPEDPAEQEPAEPVPGEGSVVINEVVSNGGEPDDWVELTNIGAEAVDISDWYLLDDDDTKEPSVFAGGTVIEPGQYVVVDRDELGFGLGKGDMARLFSPAGTLVDTADWPEDTHATPSLQRCPEGTGDFELSTITTKGAANNCAAPVVIHEISSQGEDFVELRNVGDEQADLGGYVLKDAEDDHVHEFPEGTTLDAGELLLVTGEDLGFGLGGDDAARLFAPDGALLDEVAWTAHVSPSYGLCEGDLVTQASATPGEANDCIEPEAAAALPTTGEVAVLDGENTWAEDLSGLDAAMIDGEMVLWATNNDAGQISRLVENAEGTFVGSEGWPAGGIPTRFPDGAGTPDGEGISYGPDGKLYQSIERDNDQGGTSHNAVLRFDPAEGAGADELIAEAEWDLTGLLPETAANAGLEAIEVGSASDLANLGGDVPAGAEAYAFVALEATGDVYAVALMPDGSAELVATLASPFDGVMALDLQESTGMLRAFCDEACEGESVTYDLRTDDVTASQRYARPTGMENIANEGVAIAPWETCTKGALSIYYADDANTGGHSLRGTELTGLDCAADDEPAEDTDPGTGGDMEPGVGDTDPGTGGDTGADPVTGPDPVTGENLDPGAEDGSDAVEAPSSENAAVPADSGTGGSVSTGDPTGTDPSSSTSTGSVAGSSGTTSEQALARTGMETSGAFAVALAALGAGFWMLRRSHRV
ncbi:lamin tail domain-containing protein [Brachybacterium sp. FME24]|uniref:lamin tail domain-containing protein n=1 Tax=Brachybacterium sp. FME24 TaxID=2742605 RepID=UPI001867538F|nr:lamin tail domain-containing protein [Brachybacterium sp. FME24]